MALRMTGLVSGMDTESIIQELVAAKQTKVDDLTKAQTKLKWKQDAWKELNTKLKKLYDGTLGNLRFESSFTKKTTNVSNSSAVSVITSDTAMNAVQSLKINSMSKSAYMTGGTILQSPSAGGEALTADSKVTSAMDSVDWQDKESISFNLTTKDEDGNDKITEITLTKDSTIADVTSQIKAAGLNANFDATNQRFYIGSTESGDAGNFSFSAVDTDTQSLQMLTSLGLNTESSLEGNAPNYQTGQDASITLNGVDYTSSTNTFEVNGLTISVLSEATDPITISTEDDTEGIYDMIKTFIKEYSTLMNEFDKLYNADSAKDYEPLTDDEKESMSETAIEKWETTIKDSLLRNDSVLSTLRDTMQTVMAGGITVDGKTMYLSEFGIETLSYFDAADNEKHAYHIDGDEDDDNTKNKTNKLMQAIKTDPNSVVSFFTQLSKSLYGKVGELMTKTDYSSSYTVYDDVRMQDEYDDYTDKIKEEESKVQDYEDKWYAKFSAMETALAKLQSNANAVTSLLGG